MTPAPTPPSLTRHLLAFGRQQVLRLETLQWNDIVRHARAAGRLGVEDQEEGAIALELRLDSATPPVRADREQLDQVLINLVVNAREAMRATGGRLIISTGGREVGEIEARRHPGMRPGHYAWLAVQDTGVGFDKRTESHIFEPFFTTKIMNSAATGFGLSTFT